MTLQDLPIPREAMQWIIDTLRRNDLREPKVAAGQCSLRSDELRLVLHELGYTDTRMVWVHGFRGDHTGHGYTEWPEIWNHEFGHCVLRVGLDLEYVIDMTSAQLGPQHPIIYMWAEFTKNWERW